MNNSSFSISDRLLKSDISIESDVPLYYQLVNIIKSFIAAGAIKAGDSIPGEYDFCKAYSISRSTVRRAISELEEQGLVIRRRGLGTFISEPKLNRSINKIYSFTNDMKILGLEPSSIIQDFKITLASEALIKVLKLSSYDKRVFKITRLRCANDEPLLLETTILPVRLFPTLKKDYLINNSLYELLQKEANIVPFEATETYESTIIVGKTAKLLKCKDGVSGFNIERIAWEKSGKIYEFTQSIMKGDRTKLVMKLSSNSVQGNLITPSIT